MRKAEILAGIRKRLFILVTIAVAMLAGACESPDNSAEGGGLLGMLDRTAGLLRDTMSADYDPPDAGPPLGELPEYYVGDAYTYSSGRTETIEGVANERIVWRNDLSSRFERHRNFILPTARTRTDRGEVTREVTAAPDMLWPLIPGTRRQFTSKVRVRRGRTEQLFNRDWICSVDGVERVSVRVGEFDAVKISCDRYGRGKWRQKRVWYYVPEIGHYVRRVDSFLRRESREVELVSIKLAHNGLSETARRSLYEMQQRTLERMPSGKPASWKADDGELTVTMTVTRTMRTSAGQFCRSFREEFNESGADRLVPGLACRTWNGRWVRL